MVLDRKSAAQVSQTAVAADSQGVAFNLPDGVLGNVDGANALPFVDIKVSMGEDECCRPTGLKTEMINPLKFFYNFFNAIHPPLHKHYTHFTF